MSWKKRQMRQWTVVSLLAMAFALMACVTTASGTTITSPGNAAYTGEIQAESESHTVLDNPVAKIECSLELSGTVKSHGAGQTAVISLASLTTPECTNSWHYTTVSPGVLEIHWVSGSNGTVTSNGMTIEATRFGVNCRYGTSSTDFGFITGGSPATIDIAANIPFHSGSFLCGSGSTPFTGGLAVTTPASLFVDS